MSGPRLPFTAAYFSSIGLTLYFAVGVSEFPFFILQMLRHPPFCLPRDNHPVEYTLLLYSHVFRCARISSPLCDVVGRRRVLR